ncbi:hypothetical protein GF373_17250 [bacterium]|nr:hypothetical protein [bacterium]
MNKQKQRKLYEAYVSQDKKNYKWLNDKEMIVEYDKDNNTPTTIEFCSKEVCVKRWYRESGELEYEWQYKNGKLHGPSRGYYKSGELEWETQWKNGKRHGPSRGYHESGELCWEWQYENGELVSSKYY